MSGCGNATLIGRRGRLIKLVRTRCGCWKCDTCSRFLARRLFAKALGGKPDRMLTLTVNPAKYENPHEAARALVEGWRRMRQALRASHRKGSIPFLAVFETHKSGWPHLHVLIRGTHIPRDWASRYMERRTGGWNVDVRRIRGAKHAAQYAVKYATKSPAIWERCKRYWSNPAYFTRKRAHDAKLWEWRKAVQSQGLTALMLIAGDAEIVFQDHRMMILTAAGPP